VFPNEQGRPALHAQAAAQATEDRRVDRRGERLPHADRQARVRRLDAAAEGVRVYGFGARQTPRAFVAACTSFIDTESIAAG
jgi:hypothetical protein